MSSIVTLCVLACRRLARAAMLGPKSIKLEAERFLLLLWTGFEVLVAS